jgi:hypothetical protein
VKGEYWWLLPDLPEKPDKFYKYCRMSQETFNWILEKNSPRFKKRSELCEFISLDENVSF